MRKALLASISLLLLVSIAGAQEVFIPDQEKQQRIEEIKALAQQLLAKKKDDTHVDATARAKIRDEMVKLDVIVKDGRPAGNGFSVPAFDWLYQEGQKLNDVNARLQAIIGLEQVQHASAVAALLRGLNDGSPAIQLRVLGAVKRDSIQRAWTSVLPLVKSPNRAVVAAAAEALAKLGQDPDKQVSDMILQSLSAAFDKLKGTAETEAEERQSLEELVEVLGRSYAELVRAEWPNSTKIEEIEEAINKFKAARNMAFLGGLRDPVPKERLQALRRLKETPEKSVFFPVLEAAVKEAQNLENAATPEEKAPCRTFLTEASQLLNTISGLTENTAAATPEDLQQALGAWRKWYQAQIEK